jgi:Fe-S-cluster containining protein
MTASALGIQIGNEQLDAFLRPEVLTLVHLGQPAFAGKSADRRLARARAYVDVLLPLVNQQADRELGRTIACGQRCPACCIYSDRIDILPIELRSILDVVEREGRLEEVARRAELRRSRGKGACPLLSRNGRCTVYAERPLSCRWYHSLDRDACRRCAHDGKTTVPWIPQLFASGLALTILAQSEPVAPVDLFTALPAAVNARLRQAKKRRRRAPRGRT